MDNVGYQTTYKAYKGGFTKKTLEGQLCWYCRFMSSRSELILILCVWYQTQGKFIDSQVTDPAIEENRISL